MFRTLHSKLLTFFLALSLGGILLISIAIFFGFQETFNDYLTANRDEQIEQISQELKFEFQSEGRLSGQSIQMMLNHYAVHEQLFFRVFDANGQMIVDSTEQGNHMNHRMMGRSRNSGEQVDVDSDLFDEKTMPLTVNGEEVGTLIAHYPATFMSTDVEFLKQFSKYLIGAVLIMTILSFILSFVFSKRLSSGLKQMSQATSALKQQELNVRVPTEHHVKELEELSEGFNDLVDSLQTGDKLRKQFTSDLAHELRTPLATLRSQLESFQDGVFEPTPERLNQCHHELMRLVRLVNEMEKLHAAENPQIKLNLESIDAKKVLHALYNQFYTTFQEKGVQLSIKEPEDVFFSADRDRFMQIMTNLLNNALKYTDPGGSVTLHVEQNEEGTHLSVTDTGRGMNEEELTFIYERFYRGEKSRNRETGGLGIGMSIVKALVDAHGGMIDVKSEKGRGTTFTVTFRTV
ncbi:ATP-binding protein [Texcoconibacillus texcoconensis]|uniref:histidine kinase n=1 Tax=Texcoconibacillus texcoconensis TaxID=1095777 RepID=A0A840QTV7_9BACI|nr:ATP-binding protein [Texcoconibacillus texcoconensis]MBB5174728.1 signal transduction histidine kinase [Texcoconibacillus texcoconensis]